MGDGLAIMTPSPQPLSFLPRPSALFKNLGPIEGDYLRNLRGIESESLRRAWIEGDMNAMTGMYFKDWRPHGHLAGEPECAHHVYDPATLRIESWWHLWGSLDWGYIHPTAMQWHRKAPWGQTLTFKELALNRTEPFELGVMLARECKPMLLGLREETPHINFYISPDAWSLKESDFPPAMQMCKGIDNVLGPQSSFAMTMDEAEKSMRSPTEAFQSMLKRRGDQRAARISLIMASTNRVSGWMRMQSLLRFRPLNPVSTPDMDHAHALYEEKGLVSYQEYLNSPEFAAPRECLPGWRVSRDCVNLIEFMRKAVYKPGSNDIQKFDFTESSAGDDSGDCFVAGTLIKTEHGDVPVENVIRGDRVWTRQGLRRVLVAGPTREKPTLCVELSNGAILQGSGEHPIWIDSIGWECLDSLRYGDILGVWPYPNSSFSTESNSAAIQNQDTEALGSTSTRPLITSAKEWVRSIVKYGSPPRDQSRKDSMSITRTEIRSTTKSTTTNCFLKKLTTAFIQKIGGILTRNLDLTTWTPSAQWRPHGMALMPVGSGIASTPSILCSKPLYLQKWFARNAARRLSQEIAVSLNFATQIASSDGEGTPESITFGRTAISAGLDSKVIKTSTLDAAPVSVARCFPGQGSVLYNLMVEEVPEYYANGVLVHNCARYGILSEHIQGEKVAPLEDRIEGRAAMILTAGMDPTTRIQVIAAAARKESGVEARGAREFGHNRMAVMRSLRAKGSIMTQREPHQRRIFKP